MAKLTNGVKYFGTFTKLGLTTLPLNDHSMMFENNILLAPWNQKNGKTMLTKMTTTMKRDWTLGLHENEISLLRRGCLFEHRLELVWYNDHKAHIK